MRGEPWSQAELDWLRERWPTMSVAEIVESYPGSFPIRTPMALQSKAKSLGLRKADGYDGMRGRRTWTPEADAWLRSYAPGHSTAEIVREARERLGMELSTYAVKNRIHKLGLKTGVNSGRFRPGHQPYTKGVPRSEWMSPEAIERCRRTQFAKGQAAHNTAPVGSERVNSAGIVEVKVAERPFGGCQRRGSRGSASTASPGRMGAGASSPTTTSSTSTRRTLCQCRSASTLS